MPNTRTIYRKRGFTILELSIVVLIIALLMGGVIGGKNIIRLAELRSVITDKEKYIAAMNSFMEKYKYLPGDYFYASRYWALKATCPAVTPSGSDKVTETCNGNGNKRLDTGGEEFLLWQHLSLSGMIDGSYYGVPGAAGNQHAIPGWNVPASRVDGGGFSALNLTDALVAATGYYPGQYGIVLLYGKAVSPTYTFGSLLSVEDARSIDAKSDDGKPATGLVRSPTSGYTYRVMAPVAEPACTLDGVVLSNSTYNLDANGQCALVFLTGFN